MQITVAINTLNAEKFLAQVLESVKKCDEILICDMHSEDRTLEIAKHYGAKVIFHERTGYVEPARNFLIQNAKNPWVLLLDADETVSEELLLELENRKNSGQEQAFAIARKNYFMGRFMHGAYPDYNIRFFKRDLIYWPEEIHSNPQINGKVGKLPPLKHLAINHLANDSLDDILKKTNSYTNQEIQRRGAKKANILKLFFSPFGRFVKHYFIKKGFLDGVPGFLFATTKAHYKFYTVAKQHEKAERKHLHDK